MTFLIDYASVDGNRPPDFARAKAAGLRGAIVRAAYSTWPDVTCARDRAAIRDAGLVFGAYLMPVTDRGAPEPEEQVRVYLANACLIPGRDFAPVLDLEWSRGIAATGRTRAELATWIARARTAVRAATGVDPIIYGSQRVIEGSDTDALAGSADEAIRGCPAWCARYPFKTRIAAVTNGDRLAAPPVPSALGDADAWWMHQYQGDATGLPGFSATVDLDRFNLLRAGARGTRVAWVQRRIGMAEGTPGVWDDAMDAAVEAWQRGRGLVADRVIGPVSFAALSWAQLAG
jgi:GH25 family lysozyme M1 (1,4-beta-N-acetylmuramidase)